jgi:hypothetical protein
MTLIVRIIPSICSRTTVTALPPQAMKHYLAVSPSPGAVHYTYAGLKLLDKPVSLL